MTAAFLPTGKPRLPAYVPDARNGRVRIIVAHHVKRSGVVCRYAVEFWRAAGWFSTTGRFAELYEAQVHAWRSARKHNAMVTLSPDHFNHTESAGGRS